MMTNKDYLSQEEIDALLSQSSDEARWSMTLSRRAGIDDTII